MTPTLDAKTIASYCLTDPKHPEIQLGQTEHRINLIRSWNIQEGDRVLELGCGQGDCTVALAAAVGDNGSVTAVDPAPLEYGSPYTVRDAQKHAKESPVGHRITFNQGRDTLEFLESTKNESWDVAVLAHCIWYFANPSTVVETFKALRPRVKRLCVAEYALRTAGGRTGVPHVLAALAHASLECRKPASEANIRTLVSPLRIAGMATAAGWERVAVQGVVTVPSGMLDGQWEVGDVLGKKFHGELVRYVENERERAVVEALIDATRASRDELKEAGLKVSTMDVWFAVFE